MITTFSPRYMEEAYKDSFGLFYDEERNVFYDEDGFIIWSIFEIISPNDLLLFKKNKEYMLVHHQTMPEVLVELYYPEGDDERGRPVYTDLKEIDYE